MPTSKVVGLHRNRPLTNEQEKRVSRKEELARKYEEHALHIAAAIRAGVVEALVLITRDTGSAFEVVNLGEVDPLIHIGMCRLAEQQMMDEILA